MPPFFSITTSFGSQREELIGHKKFPVVNPSPVESPRRYVVQLMTLAGDEAETNGSNDNLLRSSYGINFMTIFVHPIFVDFYWMINSRV